ncbi:MAG: hypothetical protein JXR05_05765 [Flavobacteriaceae bacterium]
MRLLILPFDDKNQPLRSDIHELESSSKEEILNDLNLVMKGKIYQVEIYKNINDSLYFSLSEHILISAFNYKEKTYHGGTNINPYETMIDTIGLYLNKNGSKVIETDFKKEEEAIKAREKEKYEKWKKQYTITSKEDKKTNVKRIGIAFAIIIILFFLGKLIWDDDLRFIGRKTEVKKGVITNIGLIRVRSGGHYKRVTYEFTFNNKKYTNYFTANRFTRMPYKKDSILIQFEVNNPDNSKFIP